ncbi:MAG: hydrogenase formation protein HypD [Candidatus Omnitrophica bacterium]|nr:hydrogenase formation protein HypD [Candidatus Omnitrophota bacterium]
MKYIDEFRNSDIAKNISVAIAEKARRLKPINIMEVCGTHTMSICNFGIKDMLPDNVNFISGPGCPVCVTPKSYIDKAVAFSKKPGVILTTFGDMVRVPGSNSSLREEKAKGRHVRIVYSALDAVELARKNPDKKVIFLGIGFETTSPTVAASLVYAKKQKLCNFFVFSGHKVILPAMEALVKDGDVRINGFLCPAHVSTIIGKKPYTLITGKYKTPCVIAGFEPLDILQGIYMILEQITSKISKVENQYKRVARDSGNKKALTLINEVFSVEDSEWRGIGMIRKSGLFLNKKYSDLDAEKVFPVKSVTTKPDAGCICGSILKGIKTPFDCPSFSKTCTPEKPKGACMVSSEGTCAAYYKYRIWKE